MIVISHNHAEGTTVAGSSKGDGVWELARARGFRYSRQVGIYLRGSRDADAQEARINGLADDLRAAGHEVAVEIDNQWRPAEERETDRAERVDARADRYEERAGAAAGRSAAHRGRAEQVWQSIPAGQPMLTDHYSYRGDRNRRERANRADDRSREEASKSAHLGDRAAGARSNEAAKADPRAIMRRMDRLGEELRQWQRRLATATSSDYQDRITSNIARLEEDIAHQQAKLDALAASGEFVAWSPATVAKGDRIYNGFGWYTVLRVNPKSVSIEHEFGRSTVKWDGVFGRRRDGMQLDRPNGEPWPVETARKVARWARVQHSAELPSERYSDEARHVRWALRLVHGLPLTAGDQEVQVCQPTEDDVPARRALAVAYLGVYDRLAAGERVPDIEASITPWDGPAAWRLPAGEPVDRLEAGDLVAGLWDQGYQGRRLIKSIVGPVATGSAVDNRGERGDWVVVTMADGTVLEFQTHQWCAVYPSNPTQEG
jgi:hypothetical protein